MVHVLVSFESIYLATKMSSSKYLIRILFEAFLLFICLLCSTDTGYANELSHSHIVSPSSLLPPTACNRKPLPQGSGKVTLEVVSKYGPCSTLNQGKIKTPSLAEILCRDNLRLNLKRSRLSHKPFTTPAKVDTDNAEYYITAAIGTPKQNVSLMLDSGSSSTWTQCKPCNKSCFEQTDSVFDPSKSKTFVQLLCGSQLCKFLLQKDGQKKCTYSKGVCPYNVAYVGGAFQSGFWATDRLIIQKTNRGVLFSKDPYWFGCVTSSSSDLSGLSGIMGLDRNPVSFISQTKTSYFSYCLPPHGFTGYISFGKTDDELKNKSIKFTPITTTIKQSDSYDITLTGISVGGEKLPIKSSAYTKFDSSIDSGTYITRFPTPIYAALRTAFRKKMSKYKLIEPIETFDTCYDLRGYENAVIPNIALHFLGGADLELDKMRVVIFDDASRVCLAFASLDYFLLGNFQQRGYEVHHDVAGNRLGFGPRSCS